MSTEATFSQRACEETRTVSLARRLYIIHKKSRHDDGDGD
jgi:hypothetical protein